MILHKKLIKEVEFAEKLWLAWRAVHISLNFEMKGCHWEKERCSNRKSFTKYLMGGQFFNSETP